jgi:SAM-dependent methyltransferase
VPASISFDETADLYDEVRPGYADSIIESIVSGSAVPPHGRLLEISAGTGQITVPLAARGYRIRALEPGAALAQRCRVNCQPWCGVEVIEQRFEDFTGPEASFDLLVSAQAFHWIEPVSGFARGAAFLKPGGAIALVWHFDVSGDTAFYAATAPVYDRYFPSETGRICPSLPSQAMNCERALAASPAFASATEIRHRWSQIYPQAQYLKLLQTHSPVLGLTPAARANFLSEIGALIRRQGGAVQREYETYLLVARRR